MTKIAVEIHKKDNKLYFKGSFPDLCVCCGQPKNVDKTYKADRVKKSHENSLIVPETLTLKLPYCTKHGEAFVFAKNAIAITVGFFVILAAFPAYWFFEWLFFALGNRECNAYSGKT